MKISKRITYMFFMLVGFIMALDSFQLIRESSNNIISLMWMFTFAAGIIIAGIGSFLFGTTFSRTKHDTKVLNEDREKDGK